jgi:hypothetical protein
LRAIGIDEEEMETAISQEAWTVAETYSVFGTDFENCMRASFEGYEVLEEEAKKELGESKPLVARFVADRLERDDGQTGWQRITQLASVLRSLSIAGSINETQENEDVPF